MEGQKSMRRDRFERVAARRVRSILQYIDHLANCANRNNYEYDSADVKKMFGAIKEKVRTAEAAFDKELNRSQKDSFKF